MAHLTEIWRYPVKSFRGEPLEEAFVTPEGLESDRRFAYLDSAPNRLGKKLTARQVDQMLSYRARLAGERVEVETPTGEVYEPGDPALVAEISRLAGRSVSVRDSPGENFDETSVLLVNQATVDAFEMAAGMGVDRRRFRANLYVSDLEPDQEYRWLGRRLRVGEAVLEAVRPCGRCVVITIDPDTLEVEPGLLRTLARERQEIMGIRCAVVKPGQVRVGDPVGPE